MKIYKVVLVLIFGLLMAGCGSQAEDQAIELASTYVAQTATSDAELARQTARSAQETATQQGVLNETKAADDAKLTADEMTAQVTVATERPTAMSTSVPARTSAAPPPTAAQAAAANCRDSSGGKHKVRIENRTEGNATLYFNGPENVSCTVAGGVSLIYIVPGVYSVTARMCGTNYDFGSGVINNTWKLILRC